MISKILESLYKKVFINIILNKTTIDVYVELYSKKETQENYEQSFKTTTPNEEMIEYIESFTKESPYFYISLLDYATEQGALPTCDKNKFSFYTDLSTAEYRCIHNKWLTYTSKIELYEIEKSYEAVGLDFIFSPFSVLENFFEDKVKSHFALYILIEERFISCAVFEDAQLLFANHLDMELESDYDAIDLDDDIDEELDLEDEGIILDDIDAEESMESLEDLSDIEDLDALEDIDEFSDTKDLEEELEENTVLAEEAQKAQVQASAKSFNDDYQRFTLIRESINKYYKSDKYDSKFLENVYVADAVKVSGDLRRYLEEELFLNVYIRSIDLGVEVCELAKKELGL